MSHNIPRYSSREHSKLTFRKSVNQQPQNLSWVRHKQGSHEFLYNAWRSGCRETESGEIFPTRWRRMAAGSKQARYQRNPRKEKPMWRLSAPSDQYAAGWRLSLIAEPMPGQSIASSVIEPPSAGLQPREGKSIDEQNTRRLITPALQTWEWYVTRVNTNSNSIT